jgi:hypothetical protein
MISDVGGFNGTIVMICQIVGNFCFRLDFKFRLSTIQSIFQTRGKPDLLQFKVNERITRQDAERACAFISQEPLLQSKKWLWQNILCPCCRFVGPEQRRMFKRADSKVAKSLDLVTLLRTHARGKVLEAVVFNRRQLTLSRMASLDQVRSDSSSNGDSKQTKPSCTDIKHLEGYRLRGKLDERLSDCCTFLAIAKTVRTTKTRHLKTY